MRLVTPTWPSGHRCALAIAITVDAPTVDRQAVKPGGYAMTGSARLLRLLADVDVRATFGWSTAAAETWPGLLSQCASDGHEIASFIPHCSPAPGPPTLVDTSDRALHLSTAINRLRVLGAEDVTGLIWGADAVDDSFRSGVTRSGIAWLSRAPWADLPTIADAAENSPAVVEIPVWDRSSAAGSAGFGIESTLARWRDDLDVLRDEGALLGVRLDAAVAGQPGFSRALLHLLDDATDLGDVWVARLGEIGGWWLERDREERR